MNKLPIDIITEPLVKVARKSIWDTQGRFWCELQVFRQAKKVSKIVDIRSVFDFREPPSGTFKRADIGWEWINPRNFVPVPWVAPEKGVLLHRKRPNFLWMQGYLLSPYFNS